MYVSDWIIWYTCQNPGLVLVYNTQYSNIPLKKLSSYGTMYDVEVTTYTLQFRSLFNREYDTSSVHINVTGVLWPDCDIRTGYGLNLHTEPTHGEQWRASLIHCVWLSVSTLETIVKILSQFNILFKYSAGRDEVSQHSLFIICLRANEVPRFTPSTLQLSSSIIFKKSE